MTVVKYTVHCHISSLPVPQTERDVSVRQRAIDLLYAMCDHANAQTIVEELLRYLEKADYSIRETLVCVCVLCVSVSYGGEAMLRALYF